MGEAPPKFHRLVLPLLAAAAIAACNQLLGTPSPILADDAGTTLADGGYATESGPPADGGSDGAATRADATFDGPTIDAAADAGRCCGEGGCVPLGAGGLANDPKNCGSCGHDCLGGACANGICKPFVLAGSTTADLGLFSLYGFTLVGDTLYGTDWYDTFSLIYSTSSLTPAPGGTPNAILPTPAGSANAKASADAIVSYGGQLFFIIYHDDVPAWPAGIWSLALSDGGVEAGSDDGGALTQLISGAYLQSLAVDEKYIYLGGASGPLYRAPRDASSIASFDIGRAFSPIFAMNGRVYYAGPIGVVAADRETLATLVSYADVSLDAGAGASDASGDSGDGDGGAGADDASAPSAPQGPLRADTFAIGDSGDAVWVNSATHTLYKGNGSTAPATLDTWGVPFDRPSTWILFDSDRHEIYLFDTDFTGRTGAISRVADDGSSAQIIAVQNDAISAVTQDATAIYFTTYGSGAGLANLPYAAIYKVAK